MVQDDAPVVAPDEDDGQEVALDDVRVADRGVERAEAPDGVLVVAPDDEWGMALKDLSEGADIELVVQYAGEKIMPHLERWMD